MICDIGGHLSVLQQGSGQSLAGLHAVHQFFQHLGGGFDVLDRQPDFRAVGGQQTVGGTGEAG